MTLKAQVIKARIDKWDYTKLKLLCMDTIFVQDTINKVKRTYGIEENICKSYTSNLYPEYRELLRLNN